LGGLALRCRPWNDQFWRQFFDTHRSREKANVTMGKTPNEEDPRETPADDPRQATDWPNTKQTDRPWNGKVEKDQQNKGKDIDLEKWQESNTH
jgi:hypothetical protein